MQPFLFRGKITQCTPDGARAEGMVWFSREAVRTRMLGNNAGGVVENVKTPDGKYLDALMIMGLTEGVVDGDAWSGTVYAIGRHQYTTVMGAERTVLRFTVSRDAAREYLAKQQ